MDLEKISSLGIDKVDSEVLFDKGLIKDVNILIKILGNGGLEKPIEIIADMFSKSAVEKIEKVGGKVIYR